MAINTKKKGKSKTLKLRQNLTIDSISQLYRDFIDYTTKNDTVLIQSESIENIDLTGIQFLMYSKNFASENDCKVSFDLNFSDSTKTLILKTGFSSLLE